MTSPCCDELRQGNKALNANVGLIDVNGIEVCDLKVFSVNRMRYARSLLSGKTKTNIKMAIHN